jgi:phage-related protein
MPHTVVRVFQEVDEIIPVEDWLDKLKTDKPKAYPKCLARILRLEQAGNELRRPEADFLRDGIYELRSKVGTVNYRIAYFFYAANSACLSHGFTKEGKVPDAEIDLAIKRKKLVMQDPDRYAAEWDWDDWRK